MMERAEMSSRLRARSSPELQTQLGLAPMPTGWERRTQHRMEAPLRAQTQGQGPELRRPLRIRHREWPCFGLDEGRFLVPRCGCMMPLPARTLTHFGSGRR